MSKSRAPAPAPAPAAKEPATKAPAAPAASNADAQASMKAAQAQPYGGSFGKARVIPANVTVDGNTVNWTAKGPTSQVLVDWYHDMLAGEAHPERLEVQYMAAGGAITTDVFEDLEPISLSLAGKDANLSCWFSRRTPPDAKQG